ncbi:MAG: universal stress protein [Pseudomonadota bacterium]
MQNIKKILFPVDLSEVAPKIASWVRILADKFEAEVHLLFVARTMGQYVGIHVPFAAVSDFESEIVKGAEQSLLEFVQANFPDRQVVFKVASGYPADEILNYAEAKGMDLIIMGTHGRKGLERIFFGSVAENVVKRSQIPVLTVNPFRMAATAEAEE